MERLFNNVPLVGRVVVGRRPEAFVVDHRAGPSKKLPRSRRRNVKKAPLGLPPLLGDLQRGGRPSLQGISDEGSARQVAAALAHWPRSVNDQVEPGLTPAVAWA